MSIDGDTIAEELMKREVRRLAGDHFLTPLETDCDGCLRAIAIADWLGLPDFERQTIQYYGGEL